ncbi:rCG46431 [Rattus norvegicus]|uniref:RCG46431 n=1 Tax=Rattus norvegicus TaxID=10116 RepID=A6ICN6_RAT|nr:rCG46431 [Rattus norvegicus]
MEEIGFNPFSIFLSLFSKRNCRRHQSFSLLDDCKSWLLYIGVWASCFPASVISRAYTRCLEDQREVTGLRGEAAMYSADTSHGRGLS